MASSNVTSNVETGKEKFKSKRKIHPLINDEETALSRSSFTANYNKLSSLTVKQKASHPIFTSSDEDKDSNETEVIPKKNVEKSTKIVDVHFERPSLKIKNITARKDRQYDSSVNNEKILFSRPKFNTDLQISIPSTSQNPKTNKTDDLKKLTTLSTKMNTNRLLDYATDEDTEHDD
ncbi:GSCOCG00012664001-RA-CDS, partial [Cotesia congregata]